jgi:preprotein translocase subunit SecE
MAKEKAMTTGGFLQEIFQVGVYKRSQGRVTRQVTFAVLAGTAALAAWSLWNFLSAFERSLSRDFLGVNWHAIAEATQARWTLPAVILLAGLWLSYRAVNLPRFADFLIAVEAEMNKVSWPSRAELVRSSLVVIFVIFVLAAILFGYDIFWRMFFQFLGIIK